MTARSGRRILTLLRWVVDVSGGDTSIVGVGPLHISVIAGTIVVGVEAQAGLEVVPDHLEKNTVIPFVAALQEGSPVNPTVYPTGQRYVP